MGTENDTKPEDNNIFSRLMEMFMPEGMEGGSLDASKALGSFLEHSGLGPLFEALAGFVSQFAGHPITAKQLLGIDPMASAGQGTDQAQKNAPAADQTTPAQDAFIGFTGALAQRINDPGYAADPKAAILDEVGKLADSLKLDPDSKAAFMKTAKEGLEQSDIPKDAAHFSSFMKEAYKDLSQKAGQPTEDTPAKAAPDAAPAPAESAEPAADPAARVEGDEIGYGAPVPLKPGMLAGPLSVYSMNEGGALDLQGTMAPDELSGQLGEGKLSLSLVQTADSQGEMSNSGYRVENADTGLGYYLDTHAVALNNKLVKDLTREPEPVPGMGIPQPSLQAGMRLG